ncbi:MAG TPA: tetratricopeptide repeat protein [Pyrinomonadaceae bacterium]|nr:tetratricopeptide repeat protein [Pyrinomonadaceae bacterium]
MIGKTISHYRIVEKLGEGGMGIVYVAEDTVLGRRVAIKTLTAARSSTDQHFRGRFLREARSISKLSHPHIATIYDYGEADDGQPYIVMELIKGETLSQLMAREALTIPRIIEIIEQVAEALAEAHRHSIIHRDIKPSNIAINERGDVKVLDFGLAKEVGLDHADSVARGLLNTQTLEGVIVGTPMYLSPEQALGVEVDERSDLFSLGSVLYECIAGKPAFGGASPVEICAKVIRDDPPTPSRLNGNVPRDLDRITLKALAKKPDARYQTGADMIADLRAAYANLQKQGSDQTVTRLLSSVSSNQPSSALATLSDLFKRPRLSIGYVVAALALLTVIGVAAWYLTRARPYTPTAEGQHLYDRAVEAMREGAFFRASKMLQQVVQDENEFALAHARLAECWTELDSSDKAKDELIRAKDTVADRSVLPTVDGLRLQAVTNTVQREFAKAVEDYRALVSIVPPKEKAYALFDLGRAYEKNEQSDKAIETYQEATTLGSRQAAPFLRLGVLLGRRSRYAEAYASFDQAYKLFDTGTEIEGLIEVLLQRAVVLGLEGKTTDARTQLLQALEKSSALENKDKRIKVLLNLGNTEIIAGNPDQGQQYSVQAMGLAKASGLDNLTMQGMIDIGHAYLNKGNFAEAEKNFNEALRLAELYKGARSKARALLSLASLRSQQGDAQGARNFFQQALPFYEQGGYRKEVFQAYVILGRAEAKAGDYDSARQRFEQLLELAQQSSDQQSIALAQEGLGRVFLDQEDFPQALSHYEASYQIVKTLNAKLNMGYTSVNRAEGLWQLGHYEEARAALAEALAIAEPQGRDPFKDLQAGVHLTKARLALSEGKPGDTLAEAQKVIAIGGGQSKSTIVEVDYLSGLALSLSGRTAEGRKRCETAVTTARQLSDPSLLSDTLLAFAQAALLAGDAAGAMASSNEAQQRFAASKQYASEWRALTIAAQAGEKLGDKQRAQQLAQQASMVLSGLEQEWGVENHKAYLTRSDVQGLQTNLKRLLTLG